MVSIQLPPLTWTNLTASCFGCVMWSPKDRLVGDELFCLTCNRRESTSFRTGQHQNGAVKESLSTSFGVTYSCALSGVGMWVLGRTNHWWGTSYRTGSISSLELKVKTWKVTSLHNIWQQQTHQRLPSFHNALILETGNGLCLIYWKTNTTHIICSTLPFNVWTIWGQTENLHQNNHLFWVLAVLTSLWRERGKRVLWFIKIF